MPTTSEMHNRAINHIFASGMSIRTLLSRLPFDAPQAEPLRKVLSDLDAAIDELRHAALLQSIEDTPRAPQLRAVPSQPQPSLRVVPIIDASRCLFRFAIDEVFAFAMRGHDFYRAGDHTLWAHESEDLLLSARSGTPLAHRVGDVFYDVESDFPLYYEQA